jgi:hypothetical protein
VRRAFAGVDLSALDPFVHMDQMGEVDYVPGEPKGTPWHPHRGFETVTYMIDGVFRHQDSNGGGGLITDDDTQWMTAGAGSSFSSHHPPDQHCLVRLSLITLRSTLEIQLRTAMHRRCPVAGGQELPRRWRRRSRKTTTQGPCQRFARNCATRNLTSPHDPTLGSAFHLLGRVGR